MKILRAIFLFGPILFASSAYAGARDPFHITAAEKSACMSDAVALCSSAYPDEHRLLSCMRANRPSLSSVCLRAFDAGLRRRHMSVAASK